MSDTKTGIYARNLSRMIQMETVSSENQKDKSKFYRFRELLAEIFPHIFSVCELEDFDGSFLLQWKGDGTEEPILFMNHHDVVKLQADGIMSRSPEPLRKARFGEEVHWIPREVFGQCSKRRMNWLKRDMFRKEIFI